MTDPGPGPIRVLIVDDQQLVRAGFSMVINSQPDMQVVGEAADGLQAVRFVASAPVDIVLMDVRMPNMDGITATAQILANTTGPVAAPAATHASPAVGAEIPANVQVPCGPRVVMLTTFDVDEYVLAAIKAGASGFLLKDAPPEDMLQAIRTVHAGDAVIAPSSTRRLIEHVAAAIPSAERTDPGVLDALTEREREVLVLIARGRTNTEIGQDLFVAEATVKTHVGRILAKLGARDRVQAVVIAYETGLVSPGM